MNPEDHIDVEERLRLNERLRILRAREDSSAFVEVIGRQEGDRPIRMGAVHREWQQLLDEHPRVVLFAPVGHGKALDADTEIPTPTGWRRIRDLRVGAEVFDRDGNPTRVSWISGVYESSDVYRVTTRRGASLIADGEHQWVVRQSQEKNARDRVKTTAELYATRTFRSGSKAGKARWRVPICGAAEYPDADLPIHPYVLGAWLGDGTSTNAGFTCHVDDAEIIDRCIALEGGVAGTRQVKPGTDVFTQVIGGRSDKTRRRDGEKNLRWRLRKLGVLGNKHVPQSYLRGSIEQRRELLAGLLDTDGTVSKNSPQVEFCSTKKALADGVLELASSLGLPASLYEDRALLRGRDCGPRFRVCWSSSTPVFKLTRKAERLAGVGGGRQAAHDSIVAIDRVAGREVCCIGVEAESKTYLAGRDYVVTHNSSQITRWRLLYELGRNPNLRIGVISVSKSGVPTKFLSAIKGDIESNKRLRLVFPKLRPSTGSQKMWGERGIIVERSDNVPDPTIQMFGLYGKILGSRLDLVVIDDICNMENTLTEASREKMWEWVSGEVLSRLPRKGGRVWGVGHVWHREDVLHRLARINTYHSKLYSAFMRDEETGVESPLIPELWEMGALQEREQELGRLAPYMLRNIIPMYDDARIKQAWVERCLERGRGLSFAKSWNPADSPTFTGVDLSVASGKGGDLACVFTLTVLPDGSRRVLDIRSGRWTGPRILEELIDVHRRFGSLITTESNAAQSYLNQFAAEIATLPLRKHYTGANKRDWQWGIESLGTEFQQGRWIIPCSSDMVPHTETAAWIREATSYVPSEHTGDRLMASWIARECARGAGYGHGSWSAQADEDFLDVDSLTR